MLKKFVADLYSNGVTSDEYLCWREIWIAANGNLERKKTVDVEAICSTYGFDEKSFDLYRFVFAVETALVVSAIVLRAVAQEKSAANFVRSNVRPTEAVFLWWVDTADCLVQAQLLFTEFRAHAASGCVDFLITEPLAHAYHDLVPKAVRHTLGAFLTPAPVCAYILDEMDLIRNWIGGHTKIIEPSVGLGAFLTALFAQGWARVLKKENTANELIEAISSGFIGMEKNLASFCVARLLREAFMSSLGSNQAPTDGILWCDTIYEDPHLIRSEAQESMAFAPSRTTLVANLCLTLQPDAQQEHSVENFAVSIQQTAVVNEYVDRSGNWVQSKVNLQEFSSKLSSIETSVIQEALRHDIHSRNLGKFDAIVGNPPWVNWENLDPKYRQRITPIWPKFGLFEMKGQDRSFSKEDLCSLASYVACYRFGKLGTKVGFVLPQSVFQARKNSHGFRRFRLGDGPFLKVEKVADLAKAARFGSAVTRAAILFCEVSSESTTYPVRYLTASVAKSGRLAWQEMQAFPSDHSDMQTNWALYTGDQKKAGDFEKKFNPTTYRARTGVFTGGANAIYYVKVEAYSHDSVKIFNDIERAKIRVPVTRFNAERQFLFPFAKGRDLKFWGCDRPVENGILLPHTRETRIKPVTPGRLGSLAPNTLEYFLKHQELLTTRASLTAIDKPNVQLGFYALLRVGEYTFAPYKLAWKYISKDFCCAVIGPTEIAGELKSTILQEKLISIACETAEEAYFLCGWLSAPSIKADIERRIVGTQVSAHVIQDINLPQFNLENEVHTAIWRLCKSGHEQIANGTQLKKSVFEDLDRLVLSMHE